MNRSKISGASHTSVVEEKELIIGGGYFVPSVPVGDKRGGEFQNGEVQVTNNHVSEYAPSRGHVTTT
jgi:hypothetical protein